MRDAYDRGHTNTGEDVMSGEYAKKSTELPSESTESASTLLSRNITVKGRRTSVRLEPEMWVSLRDISRREVCTIHDICTLVAIRKNEHTSLTAAIRVFIMLYFRAACTEEGHRRAGHGDFEFMKKRARVEGYEEYFSSSRKKISREREENFTFDSQDLQAGQGA